VLVLQAGWWRFLLRLLVATGAMCLVLLWLAPALDEWQGWDWWQRSMQLAEMVAAGLLVYLVGQGLMGTRIRDFYTQKPH
jgi:putative peptidoglycan lipid II flippase